MEKIMNGKAHPWFIHKASKIDEFRLFIFHHAGGGATYYMPMLDQLSDGISVYIMQLPGRENRISDDMYDDLNHLIDDLTDILLPYLDKPFAFFGHSMGAMISFELTHILKKSYGISPEHLFLSSMCAPHLTKKINVKSLSDEQLLLKVFDLGGTGTEISRDQKLVSLILPTLRKDIKLCDDYYCNSAEALNVPVTILGGHQDTAVLIGDLLEWDRYFKNAFHVCLFKGNHFYFREDYSMLASTIIKTIKNGKEAIRVELAEMNYKAGEDYHV
ncbi:MAG: alpha/beta fold hydrolase [Hungatella sp.]|jgi:surfactin synthase thioesterase subunit|nr:alpha/beta fold hydrolase [Hungatella sp.]